MVRKNGWMRIVEAALAVMIVSGVLIVVYSSQPKKTNFSTEVENFQKQILMDFSSKENFRTDILNSDDTELKEYVKSRIPTYLGFSLKICDLDPSVPCKNDDYMSAMYKDVYVQEIIISSNLEEYSPKKVRLFIWPNQ